VTNIELLLTSSSPEIYEMIPWLTNKVIVQTLFVL